jgi:riboflavin kinase/FMN adenylyltransferase
MSEVTVLHSAADWTEKYGATKRRAVISVGNFDGLHLGHQRILRAVVERARPAGDLAGVVTFDPHPMKVLRPQQAPLLVQTLPQRLAGFASFGIDAALVLHFDLALASVPAPEFIRSLLVEKLGVSQILVGANFRFGHRQAGNVALLDEMGQQFGFSVQTVDPVVIGGEVVSSTLVRRAIAEGRAGDAAQLLGRPFALTGEIVRGSGRGSTIVFPTLNLAPEQELLPKTGVYATEAVLRGQTYRAATNVGFRPTFNGTHLSIETHLFDFSETVTEGRIEVRFWERLRDERKFNGPAELRDQIAADIGQARELFRRLDQSAIAPQRA